MSKFLYTFTLTVFLLGTLGVSAVEAQYPFETVEIYDNATGGDCTLFGIWDATTKTCTMTDDLVDLNVGIMSDGITFNGVGHSISASTLVFYYHGIDVNTRTGVTVKNVHVTGFDVGIFIVYGGGNAIENNFLEPYSAGVYLYNSDANIITGNTITCNRKVPDWWSGPIGIALESSDNNTFKNNDVYENTYGIYLISSQNNQIETNVFHNNSYGVGLVYSEENLIAENAVHHNSHHGISIFDSDNNTIAGNITDFNGGGIYLWVSSYGNSLVDNTADSNGGYTGISICSDCDQNTITGNMVTNNYYGLFIGGTMNTASNNTIRDNHEWGLNISGDGINSIYQNNIINNYPGYEQASSGPNNIWSLDPPIGGNYWSDYDELSEGCEDENADGFCDSPRVFYSNDQPTGIVDALPWTRPGGWLNHPPQIVSITGPVDPVQVGAQAAILAVFSDPDAGDTHTATWDWGNGTSSVGVVDETAQTVSGSLAHLLPGVYEVRLDLMDAAGEATSLTYQYVVVYDPLGGFITGGGWISSPAGAFLPDATITGKANWGFVAKYKKESTLPEGNLEFQLKEAGLKLQSTSLDWLVISTTSPTAILKGRGLLDGSTQVYNFILWITDGSPDKMALCIYYEEAGVMHMIYDSSPQAPIGGGSLVIHNAR